MELKRKIKQEYGSLQRYLRLSGKKLSEVEAAIRSNKENIFWLEVVKTKNVPILQEDLTPRLLKQIRDAIYVNYGTQSNFCNKAGFSDTWLSSLLRGHCKRRSKKVNKLITKLKIE